MTPNAYADLGAEKSCVGALLQDTTCLYMLDELRPEDFTCPEYAEAFRMAGKLRANRQPIDMQTLLTALQNSPDPIGDGGWAAVLLECYRYVPSTANSRAYVDIVRERSRRRHARSVFEDAITSLSMDGADVAADNALEQLRGMLGSGGGRVTSANAAQDTYSMLEAISRGELRFIPTPLPDVNAVMNGGLRFGEMTILAAYTGQGKSSLAQSIARHAAEKGFRVLFASGEMSKEQYGMRALSSMTGLDVGQLLNAKKLTAEQWEALSEASAALAGQSIEFTFLTRNVEDIRRASRRMNGLDLLIVDYLQLLDTEVKYTNDNSRVARISRTLKGIALEMGVHVLALSQFSRPLKGMGRRPRPQLSDLRDSGSIEQDADNVWLMWQPNDGDDPDIPPNYAGWYEAAQDQGDRFLLFDIAKQRMGPVGLTALQFSPRRMKFYTPHAERRNQN